MSDELPKPPPGITLMSPQEFLDRRAAPKVADFLTERIAWLKREWEAGGNYEHLNTRRKEAIYIAEKLGVKWMPSGAASTRAEGQ